MAIIWIMWNIHKVKKIPNVTFGVINNLLWEYPSLWPCSDNSWGLFLGHSLCEGAGSALGEDDTPEIITRVIKCSAGVSGTPAQGCTQEREGKKPRPGTTGADEPKGEAQTFSKERWGVDLYGKIGCHSKWEVGLGVVSGKGISGMSGNRVCSCWGPSEGI